MFFFMKVQVPFLYPSHPWADVSSATSQVQYPSAQQHDNIDRSHCTPHILLTQANGNVVLPQTLLQFCRDEPRWHTSKLTLQGHMPAAQASQRIITETSAKQELNPTLFSAIILNNQIGTHKTEVAFCMFQAYHMWISATYHMHNY